MIFNSLIPEILVSNYKKSSEFYTKILGFKMEYRRKEEGFSFLSLEKNQIMIDDVNKGRTWKTGKFEYPLGRGINFQIQVKKITPLLQRLKKHKIELFAKPEEKWYKVKNSERGNKQFLVQDPDGYLLRFFEDLGARKAK
ncbi:VOC family protein [Candidatus Woesearchaeota archaeon]|nr:VOC family protein [Candidatus Woesearchaeota archaeon]